MVTFAAIVCTAYVAAGVALFATGETPVIAPGVDFLGDKFAMVWAGWKFCSCFYMALVNWGVGLGPASAMAMVPYMAFDIFAVMDPDHWTPLAYSFITLDALTALAALAGSCKVGGVINALYVLAGVALFATGEAPVITPGVDFLGNDFAMAWAGWKFCGCLYFALVNLDVDKGLAMAMAMVPYVYFDIGAMHDTAHWTPLSASFIVLDGLMGVLGLVAYLVEEEEDGSKVKVA